MTVEDRRDDAGQRMRAAVHTRYGPPDVVGVTTVDRPTPGPGDLLVRVHATTANRTDCGFRSASPFIMRFFTGLHRPRVTVLGNEFAGEVSAIGDDVRSFTVGDRVFGYIEGRFGAHAEYLIVPADGSVATMPADATFEQAAAATEGSHYALSCINAARVESGQDVLVYGATGAIGSAAVQLLKSLGATVTAVCPTAHVDLVAGLGADRVIDYTVEDFTRHGQTYDVVIDAVGKSTFGACRRLLRPHGIYMSSDLGPGCQNPLLALVTPLLPGRTVKFPIPTHDQTMVRHFRRLLESREFTPVIDRRYPLDGIVEAYRHVETGQKVGNVVITVVPDAEQG